MKYDLNPDEMRKALDDLVAQQPGRPLVTRRAMRRAAGGRHRRWLPWSMAACLAAAVAVTGLAVAQSLAGGWRYEGDRQLCNGITTSAIQCNNSCDDADAMKCLVMHNLKEGAAK